MSSAAPKQTASTARLDDRLARLGAESQAERNVKRIAPWVASLLAHVGLIGVGFLITWSVVYLQDQPPTLVVADFYSTQFDPATTLSTLPQQTAAPAPSHANPARELMQEAREQIAQLGADPLRQLNQGAAPDALAGFAPQPDGQGEASFIGLRSTNARSIVYVIDASGSMIRSLPIVVDELSRSLSGLSPKQRFAVVFFQHNEAVTVPPGRLVAAQSQARVAALKWIGANVIPGGRSNPLRAIEAALQMEPDVVFLLSENITGSGEFEIDQRDLLARLDELNPATEGGGRRRTQINCIQFLSPDPLDTLRKIAAAHGGPAGYKYLDRSELGLGAP